MRDCRIKIKIDNGELIDLVEQYDFHLLESPAQITPHIREYDKQSYPEHSGEEIDRRTVYEPFDYKISLGYWGSEESANENIRHFFDSMFSKSGDILIAKDIELFNEYKNVKMIGIAEKWDEQTYRIAGEKGLITFDFVLRVSDPMTLESIVTKDYTDDFDYDFGI